MPYQKQQSGSKNPPDLSAEEVQSFLQDPSSYPHSPEEVRLIQTHISYVAIASPFVYKVKKPLDLGFLDFSALEARKYYCHEEIRLNSRLCDPIYEAVIPIVRTGEGLTFGEPDDGKAGAAEAGGGDGEGRGSGSGKESGSGRPVAEYAVRMRELEDGLFFHQLVDRGELTTGLIDRVVDTVADFYRNLEASPEAARWGSVAALRVNTEENFEQTGAHSGTLVPQATCEALRFYTERFYDAHAGLLERRRAEGFVLEGHGDLHLEHIHVSSLEESRDGPDVCIFDCIEFSERIRCGDVASEVAFLAMDLWYHGRPDLARYWLRRISEALGDPGIIALAPFYACYRAYVRAKVDGIRALEEEVPAEDRASAAESARRHYRLALHFALAGIRPMAVVIMGQPATGKTTQASMLAEAANWTHLSSDVIRKQQAGVQLDARPDAAGRKALYSTERTRQVYDALASRAREQLENRRCVVIDATYGKWAHRDELRSALADIDAPLFFVELTADEDRLRERLAARDDTAARDDAGPPSGDGDSREMPADLRRVSDARAEDFEMLSTRYEAPDALEDPRHVPVDAGRPEGQTAAAILRHLMRLNDPVD